MKKDNKLVCYYTNIEELLQKDLYEKGLSLVKQERQQKVLACRREADSCRALAAGLLLRFVCGQLGLDYESIHFFCLENGKPYAKEFSFNISHSGCYAVIVAGGVSAGVDIDCLVSRFEGERAAKRLAGIMDKCFDKAECLWVKEAYEEDKPTREALKRATEIWTKKESFAKELGLGLGMDFATIHTLEQDYFWSFELPFDYVVSVYTKEFVSVEFPVCVQTQEMIG